MNQQQEIRNSNNRRKTSSLACVLSALILFSAPGHAGPENEAGSVAVQDYRATFHTDMSRALLSSVTDSAYAELQSKQINSAVNNTPLQEKIEGSRYRLLYHSALNKQQRHTRGRLLVAEK